MSAPQEKYASIRVYARPRPIYTLEDPRQDCVIYNIQKQKLLLKMGYTEKRYNFDFVFGQDTCNEEIYKRVVAPLVQSAIDGFNCTFIMYGPSRSGKTHTLWGTLEVYEAFFDTTANYHFGIIPKVTTHLFAELSKSNIKVDYTVRVSLIEIFNEEVRDMLDDGTPLRLYDDPINKGSVCMKDVTKLTICSTQGLMDWLKIGLAEYLKRVRQNGQHRAYFTLLFAIYVDTREVNSRGDECVKTGQLLLVDTPASENATTDVRNRDAATLNRGLITLNNVIKALGQKSQHVPFRDSKLTRVLQNSLGGNCKTAILVNYVPCLVNWTETIAALDLAQIARGIKTTPQVNVNRKPANLFVELQEEVNKLKVELSAARSGEGFYVTHDTYNQLRDETENNNKKIVELVKRIKNLEDHKQNQLQQYNSLNLSFSHTRSYLEEMNAQFTERRQLVDEGYHKIDELNERQGNVQEAASVLLDVCQNVTTREQIYYNKLQEKCVSNEKNIGISAQIAGVALEALDENMHIVRDGTLERSHLFNALSLDCQHLREEQLLATNRVEMLPEEVRNYSEMPVPTQTLPSTSSADFGISNYVKFCQKHYNVNRSLCNCSDDVQIGMQSLIRDFDTGVSEHDPHSTQAMGTVVETLSCRDGTTGNFVQELFGTLKVVEGADNKVTACIPESEVASSEERARYEAGRTEEMSLLSTDPSNKLLEELSIHLDIFSTHRIRNQLSDPINNCLQAPEKTMLETSVVVSNICSDCDRETRFCTDPPAQGDTLNDFSEKVTSSLQENLKQQNYEFQQQLAIWNDCLKYVDSSVDRSLEIMQNLEHTLQSIEESSRIQDENTERCLLNTIEEIGESKENIERTGHAGDTPARQTYSYPKKF